MIVLIVSSAILLRNPTKIDLIILTDRVPGDPLMIALLDEAKNRNSGIDVSPVFTSLPRSANEALILLNSFSPPSTNENQYRHWQEARKYLVAIAPSDHVGSKTQWNQTVRSALQFAKLQEVQSSIQNRIASGNSTAVACIDPNIYQDIRTMIYGKGVVLINLSNPTVSSKPDIDRPEFRLIAENKKQSDGLALQIATMANTFDRHFPTNIQILYDDSAPSTELKNQLTENLKSNSKLAIAPSCEFRLVKTGLQYKATRDAKPMQFASSTKSHVIYVSLLTCSQIDEALELVKTEIVRRPARYQAKCIFSYEQLAGFKSAVDGYLPPSSPFCKIVKDSYLCTPYFSDNHFDMPAPFKKSESCIATRVVGLFSVLRRAHNIFESNDLSRYLVSGAVDDHGNTVFNSEHECMILEYRMSKNGD